MARDIDALRENLAALCAFIDSRAFVGWCAARDAEVAIFDQQIAYDAESWEDVVRLRSARQNTEMLKQSFEETRGDLKAELDRAIEAETKIAAESKR